MILDLPWLPLPLQLWQERVHADIFPRSLTCPEKKSGVIRLIAVGLMLCRLASKCANSFGVGRLPWLFDHRQLGAGTPGGCEAIHSACRYLQNLVPYQMMVKLDFANSFNSLHRPDMLQSIREHLPELYSYCYSSYSQTSFLYFGPYVILSQEVPQQGDPLGMFLFCDTIQRLLISLESELTLGYFDDVTLGGPQDVVISDMKRITTEEGDLGLHLNPS